MQPLSYTRERGFLYLETGIISGNIDFLGLSGVLPIIKISIGVPAGDVITSPSALFTAHPTPEQRY